MKKLILLLLGIGLSKSFIAMEDQNKPNDLSARYDALMENLKKIDERLTKLEKEELEKRQEKLIENLTKLNKRLDDSERP